MIIGCKKRKGFTLIELLAVIIILGVIALIVSPIIVDIIAKQEKKTFEESVYGLMESARLDTANDDYQLPREYYYEDGVLTLLTVDSVERNEEVKINGFFTGVGSIVVDEDGDIIVTNVCNEKWCANNTKENDNLSIDKNDGTNNPEIDPLDPVISLNGSKTLMVGVGSEFTDPGVKAQTHSGEELPYETVIKKGSAVVEKVETSSVATYTITYSTTSNHKTVSVTRTVKVVEMKPIITMSETGGNYVKRKSVVIKITAVSPNKVTEFQYQINEEPAEKVIGTSKTILLEQTGEYVIKVNVTDNAGYSNTATSGVYKIDATGPTITFDPEIVTLEPNEVASYNIYTGVNINDNIDGPIEANSTNVKTTGNVGVAHGSYPVTYEVSDQAGNITTKQRTFVVKDVEKPVVTITPNEQSTYVQTKNITISATDNDAIKSFTYVIVKDGISGETKTVTGTSTTITLNESGIYTIRVTATDSSDNVTTKTSGEYKIDHTAPVISFSDNVVLKKTEVNNYNLLMGVTVTDNSKETITPKTSGQLTATEGKQTITYTATDSAGNVATKIRTFTIVEAEGPILNFSSVNSGNKWVKAQNITVTATDNSNLSSFTYEVFKNGASQGVKTVTVSGKSASTSVALSQDGTYTIKLKAADQYGSSSETTSGTYKIDVTKPTINMSNVTIYDNQATSYNLMTGVTVNDNSGVAPTVKTSGSLTSTPKDYTITYTVTDQAGNVTTANRTITVKSSGVTVADKVAQSSETKTNDPGGNRRYVGANPNNYVRFNNELWRIIGIFNGQAKIIRNDFYSTGKAWDSSNVNNWSTASLKTELNGTYLNSIEATSKSYIDQSHVWNLGGYDSSFTSNGTRANFYNKERGTTVYSGRPTTWTGAIGLMYPSDWGYASSSTSSTCDSTPLYNWNNQSTCYTTSWLHNSSYHQWTLTPRSDHSNRVFLAITSGTVTYTNADYTGIGVRPVLYLKSSIKITSGSGTSSSPYILSA